MSRRLVAVLSAVCIVALSISAVALARGKSDDHGTKADKHVSHAKRAGDGPAGLMGGALLGVALDSLAQRLQVAPADLKTAIKQVAQEQMDKRLQAAGLTADEIAAVKACRQTTRFGGPDGGVPATPRHDATPSANCDTTAWKSAVAKLRAAKKTQAKPDLAALKTELATSLATKLHKTPDEVLAAVRAELDARLTQAVTVGWLTQKGHDLALACFDNPSSCDLEALRAEVTFFGHKHRRHGHHRHHGGAPSSTAPSTTTPGSGHKHPGGRASSAPLVG